MDDFKLTLLDNELYKRGSKITTLELVRYMNRIKKSSQPKIKWKFYKLLVEEMNKQESCRIDYLKDTLSVFRTAYRIENED